MLAAKGRAIARIARGKHCQLQTYSLRANSAALVECVNKFPHTRLHEFSHNGPLIPQCLPLFLTVPCFAVGDKLLLQWFSIAKFIASLVRIKLLG